MPFYSVPSTPSAEELTANMALPLKVTILDKAQEYEGRTTAVLLEAFGFQDLAERLDIKVPKTFMTDFASIPGWARAVVSPFGRHAKAAVLHDWLYSIGEPGLRDAADKVFHNAMTELEVDSGARDIMYGAVRLGGEAPFGRADKGWDACFAHTITGARLPPPFARTEAFVGAPHGPKRLP